MFMKGGKYNGKGSYDLSAQEGTESKGARLQKENVHKERQKRTQEKKTQRKKETQRIIMKKPDVLRNKDDFERLRRKGKSCGSRHVALVCLKNDYSLNRKAFLASKKVGNSVVRHRAVRLMKEAFRQIEKERVIPQGYDLLFIARNTIIDSKCADVKKSIETAIKRAEL